MKNKQNDPLKTRGQEQESHTVAADGPHATSDSVHPADMADFLEGMDLEERVRWVSQQPPRAAIADAIAEMEKHDRIGLMTRLSAALAADLLEAMSPDDATDALSELDPGTRTLIFRKMERDEARTIAELLRFDPETAGGVMTTEIIPLDQELTVDQAVGLVRSEMQDAEFSYYAYLVDRERRLQGVISLRELLINPPGSRLVELLAEQNLIYVNYGLDKEEVGRLISRYNLLAIPVVDQELHLLGAVTVDDVIDIIQEEASEDMQSMVGAGSDEKVDSPWTYSMRKRLPWLVLNLLNSAIAAWVVHLFEGTIAQMAVLAVFMPIVANQAGNTGQQALVVMIRQLALEEFHKSLVWSALWRELKIVMVNGTVTSLIVFGAVTALTRHVSLAGVMAVALGANMIIGALGGAAIPLMLRALGRDPAQASSIFLSTLTDGAGFFIFLGMAAVFLM